MKSFKTIVALACVCGAGYPALAQTSGSSGATAASVQLSAVSTLKASASVAPVSGTAPAAYDVHGGATAINKDWVLVPGLTSVHDLLGIGAATTEAYSTSESGSLSSVTGTTTLTNVSSTLQTQLAFIPTIGLGITADALTSTTAAGIDADGRLFSSGTSSISNVGLTGGLLGSLNISLSALATAAPNTVVLSLAGLQLIFNEQLVSTDTNANSIFAQTNAIDLQLNNYSYGGSLLSGSIILGHSEAQISAVPEPAAWATMIAGFGVLGVMLRRRRGQRGSAGPLLG